MDRDKIIHIIGEVMEEILEHQNFTIKDSLKASDVEGWDSLTHMMIITEIETRFEIRFKLKELSSMENIGDLIKLIESKYQRD